MKFAILSLFLIFGINLLGQVNNDYPNLIPPSPTAFELGRYGQVPVGLFTGTPNVNIPLYTYQTKNLSIPISLSYSSNGIKVDQMESNVGLGWSLNIGGVVTRVVRDEPDETGNYMFPEKVTSDFTDPYTVDFFYTAAQGMNDTETDLFMYNFSGYSGKFVYGNDKSIVQLPASPLKITPIYENSQSGFLITTPDGVKYYFLDEETTVCTQVGESHPAPSKAPSSWFLSRIEHPNGGVIYLKYADLNYSYYAGTSQTVKGLYPYFQKSCEGSADNNLTTTTYKSNVRIVGKQLSQIYSNNSLDGKISLGYSLSHPDETGLKFVGKISITDSNGADTVRSFSFLYDTYTNKRVFLSKVITNVPNETYQFSYIKPDKLPLRLSYSQDHWGYYNGAGNSYLVPLIKDEPPFKRDPFGGDRSPNPRYSDCGILSRIAYPTKGYSEFVYEPNEYYGRTIVVPPHSAEEEVYTESDFDNWGSVYTQTKTIELSFPQEISVHVAVTTNLDCIDGGVDWKATCSFKIIDVNTNNVIDLYYDTPMGMEKRSGTSFKSSDASIEYFTLQLAPGTYLLQITPTYKCVEAGASVTYFDRDAEYGDRNLTTGGLRLKYLKTSDGIDIDSTRYYYGALDNFNVSSGIRGCEPRYVYNTVEKMACQSSGSGGVWVYTLSYSNISSSSLNSLFEDNGSNICYQYVTTSRGGDNFEGGGEEHEFIVDNNVEANLIWGLHFFNCPNSNTGWDNGFEKQVKSFRKNSTGNFVVLKKELNNLTKDEDYQKEVLGFSVRKNYDEPLPTPPNIIVNQVAIDNLDIMCYKNISYWIYVDSKTTTVYDNDGHNPVTTTERYYYDNPLHKQMTRKEVVNSDGKTVTDKYYYPGDTNNALLLDRSRTGEIVKSENYVSGNGLPLVSKVVDYKDWGHNIISPEYVRSAYGNTNLEDDVRFVHYDTANGNLLEAVGRDGVHTSYIWGYQGRYLVAEIKNATYTDVVSALQGITPEQLSTSSVPDMVRISSLRSSAQLAKAFVSTFTYKPMVGVLTQTDPSGRTTYYEYDSLGRLEYVRDQDGHILNKYEYKYATQGTN